MLRSFFPFVACAVVLIGPALPLVAQTAQPASADEAAVLAPIQSMFGAMTRFDPATIRAVALPGTNLVLMRGGKPHQMSLDVFADHFSKPSATREEEQIHAPLVRIDDDLAVVWAPFTVIVDGKVDHCGTDVFNLVRVDGKWLIAAIADTGRTICGAQ